MPGGVRDSLARASNTRPHVPGRDYVNKSPDDVILIFLSLLSTRNLVKCRRVCHRWRDMIDSDVSLQYKIALWASGTVDDPVSDIGLEERLTRLRLYQSLWTEAHFTCDRRYKLPYDPSNTDARPSWEAQPSSDGSIVYIVRDGPPTTIIVCSPPSILRRTQKRVWAIPLHAVSGEILMATADVAQDLLLVTEVSFPGASDYMFHCLSLTENGQQHQDVRAPITLDDRTQYEPFLFAPKVCGRHVCWLRLSRWLEVWDWKEGTRIWRREMCDCASFAFIDASHLAVISTSLDHPLPPTLEVYCIAPANSNNQIPHPESESLVCSLQLPPSKCPERLQITVTGMLCNIHSAPGSARYRISDEDHGSSLLVVNFLVPKSRDVGVSGGHFALLIPTSTLHREINEVMTCLPASQPKAISWDNWGSKAVVLPLNKQTPPIIQQASTVALGPRYALLPRFATYDAVKHQPLVILDFSHHSTAESPNTLDSEAAATAQRLLESTLAPRTEWESIFPDSVMQSTLPYRVIVGPDNLRLRSNGWRRMPIDLVMQPDGFTLVYARREFKRPSFDTFYL